MNILGISWVREKTQQKGVVNPTAFRDKEGVVAIKPACDSIRLCLRKCAACNGGGDYLLEPLTLSWWEHPKKPPPPPPPPPSRTINPFMMGAHKKAPLPPRTINLFMTGAPKQRSPRPHYLMILFLWGELWGGGGGGGGGGEIWRRNKIQTSTNYLPT